LGYSLRHGFFSSSGPLLQSKGILNKRAKSTHKQNRYRLAHKEESRK